jgi:hypothetical protein
MNLTVFNSDSMPQHQVGYRSGLPKIFIGARGNFLINHSGSESLEIGHDDKISFAQDEDGNWYVFKDQTGFTVRRHSDKKSMMFNHGQMAKTIKESFDVKPDEVIRFIIAGQPEIHSKVKYWGLIVKVS